MSACSTFQLCVTREMAILWEHFLDALRRVPSAHLEGRFSAIAEISILGIIHQMPLDCCIQILGASSLSIPLHLHRTFRVMGAWTIVCQHRRLLDFVDTDRSATCHSFMHPNGTNVTWLAPNDNNKFGWLPICIRATIWRKCSRKLLEVVKVCHSLGFWEFYGIDVLQGTWLSGWYQPSRPWKLSGTHGSTFEVSSENLFEVLLVYNHKAWAGSRSTVWCKVQPDHKTMHL